MTQVLNNAPEINRGPETQVIEALLPFDEHNRRLQSSTHPPDWTNSELRGRYNLVVIGAGTAGLVTAAGAAGLGAKVALIEKHLTGGDCLNVGCVPSKALIRCARAAADARATAPPIKGLAEAGYLTHETVFSLTELPRRLAIIGAGPIGCEMAQAFARFGSQVTLIEADKQILIREDYDAARRIEAALVRDGVKIICGGKNVEGLNLEAVGVQYDKRVGVTVDDRLRTTNRRIFAAGDICSKYKFTHGADAMARIVIQNALFFGRAKASALTIPWCTYTDPEIAHVGMYEKDAQEAGIEAQRFTVELKDVDRAILDGEEDGFLKVHVRKGTDRILGATLVARHAGEMISEITLATVSGAGLGALAKTIDPYPTQADVFKRAGDAYSRTRLTPFVKKLFNRLLAWRR